MRQILKIFNNNKSIEKKLFYFFNFIKLILIIILNYRFKYKIKLKKNYFLFNFLPLGKQSGSYGLFIFREDYEPLLYNLDLLIKKNDCVIDVGANQGIYSLAMAKIVKSRGKVIAVEPFSSMTSCLKNNMKINSINNIKIIESLISNKQKTYKLNFNHGTVSASIVKKFKNNKYIKVKSLTIDQICSNFKKVNFIKLDIEGAEMLALEGAKKTLKNSKPVLSVEVNKNSFKKISNFLRKYNYEPYIFNKNNKLKLVTKINSDYPNLIFK